VWTLPCAYLAVPEGRVSAPKARHPREQSQSVEHHLFFGMVSLVCILPLSQRAGTGPSRTPNPCRGRPRFPVEAGARVRRRAPHNRPVLCTAPRPTGRVPKLRARYFSSTRALLCSLPTAILIFYWPCFCSLLVPEQLLPFRYW
jgi:hypothetical protein